MTVALSPFPILRFTDNNGNSLVGGTLTTLQAGTNTPLTTYIDSTGTTPHDNPITLNGRGEVATAAGASSELWLIANTAYDYVLADAQGNRIETPQNITALALTAEAIGAALYPRSPAEVAHGVFPTAYAWPWGNPRRQGAPIDGTTSAVAALTTQNSTGEQIYLTDGTYLIDSNTTLSSPIWAETNAIFKVANGVTLFITGSFDGSKTQHFQLVGTGIVQFGSAPNQTQYVPVPALCPEYWGATGVNGSGDDTAAVQACVNYLQTAGRQIQFLQDYPVSQIVLTGNELDIDFNNFNLIGNSTVATTSVLDIKCGYSTLTNVRVDANFNPLYQCAIHWYTNNLNLYYPGFNRIYGMWPRNALIGLCIGGLPTQSLPLPAQNTVQAAGIATDAPLSESTVFGFQAVSCLNPVYGRQPNGKVNFQGAVLLGSHAGWTSYGTSGYTNASTCSLIISNDVSQSTELSFQGGTIEQNSEATGTLMQLSNCHVVCDGTIMEAICPSYISGNTTVSLNKMLNFGWGFPGPYSPILIDQNAIGWLNITDSHPNMPPGYLATAQPTFIKGASSIAGTFAANYGHFTVNFTNCELQDMPFTGASVYNVLTQGVNYTTSKCTLTSYNNSGVRTVLLPLDEAPESKLEGVIDASNYSITAYGANGNATSGGWTFAVTGAGSWGSEASGLTVEGYTLDKALHMHSAAGGNTQATTAKFNVEPEKTYQLSGWIKSSTTVGGANGVIIRAVNFLFGGSAAATPTTNIISCPDTQFQSTFQQLEGYFTVPKDTTQIELQMVCSGGSDMTIAGIEIV